MGDPKIALLADLLSGSFETLPHPKNGRPLVEITVAEVDHVGVPHVCDIAHMPVSASMDHPGGVLIAPVEVSLIV